MGAKKKSEAPAVANKAHRAMMDMVKSDSDSYGSEGGLKAKPEPKPKKRGGKKRMKNGELVSCSQMTGTVQGDSDDQDEMGGNLKMGVELGDQDEDE